MKSRPRWEGSQESGPYKFHERVCVWSGYSSLKSCLGSGGRYNPEFEFAVSGVFVGSCFPWSTWNGLCHDGAGLVGGDQVFDLSCVSACMHGD